METSSEKKDNTIKLSKVSFIALLVFLVILLAILFYLLFQWQQSKTENTTLTSTITTLQNEKSVLQSQIANLSKGSGGEAELSALLTNMNDILANEKVTLLNEGVDAKVVADIIAGMPAGNAKNAVSTATLLALRKYRFRLGGHSPAYGFDSPEFVRYVLSFTGKDIPDEKNRFLSDVMMEQLSKTDDPKPGDLMFFEGSPGNIGLFYLGTGNATGAGLGIGFLGQNFPCGIYDTKQIESSFLGYYKVNY
jgi:cell wall-associated NlpC family hydrolase